MEQSVEASIGFSALAHESSQCNDLLHSIVFSILISLQTNKPDIRESVHENALMRQERPN